MQAKESDKKLFDHTDAASMNPNDYSQKLTGASNSQVGVGKSFKVYPGDKVRIEAWAKYYNPTSTTSNLTGFASMLLSAFGLSAPGGGETGTAAAGLNNWGAAVAGGGGHDNNGYPKGYVNIVLFDKNYNLLDIAYQQIDGGEQVGVSPKAAHDQMISEYTVKEEGYAYLFVSNESPTLVELYFDDVSFLHTKSNVIQYNEYYPFGMMAERTWTREGAKGNNYLHNGGTESNALTGLYDLGFRNYDPILGRMAQVDPMADKYGSLSTYNYSFNDPVYWNDPMGADPTSDFWAALLRTAAAFINGDSEASGMSITMRGGTVSSVSYMGKEQAVESGFEHHNDFGTLSSLSGSVDYTNGTIVYSTLVSHTAGNFNLNGDQVIGKTEYDVYEMPRHLKFKFIPEEFEFWAYKQMLMDQRIYGKEIAAYYVTNEKTGARGILILPWAGNDYDYADHRKGMSPRTGKITDHNGEVYVPFKMLHTHPDGVIPSRRRGDLEALDDLTTRFFPGMMGVIIDYRQYNEYPGGRHGYNGGLLNGSESLFPK